MGGHRCR
jgi:hypothetical protein